jgi:hypothetical protein
MACGDRYLPLIVTHSGYTPENPFGVAPTLADYNSEWHPLASKLAGAVSSHMAALHATELKQATGGTPKFLDLADDWAAFLRRYEALPSMLIVLNPVNPQPIRKAIDVTLEAACMLEQIDDAIAAYGESPPELPTPGRAPAPKPPSLADGFSTVVVVGAIAALAYFFFVRGIRG